MMLALMIACTTEEELIIQNTFGQYFGSAEAEAAYIYHQNMEQYTDEEIYLIERVVETETYQCSFDAKTHVASVVINRLNVDGQRFGKSIKKIVTSKNQFCYGRKKISNSTKEAVEYVIQNGDTAQGALFFKSGHKTKRFSGGKFVFQDDAVHYFYK